MAQRFALIALVALLLAAAPASNQVVDQTTLVANQPGNYAWKATAPPTGTSVVTYGQFKTWVNSKTPCPAATDSLVMDWATVLSCSAGRSASQQTTNLSGTASGNQTCNLNCSNSGGTAQSPYPYVVTMTVNQVDATHPVALSMPLTLDTGASCSWTLADGGGVTQASGTGITTAQTATANVTIGATGSWKLTLSETIAHNYNALNCYTSSGTLQGYV